MTIAGISIETDLSLEEILEIDANAWATPLEGSHPKLPELATPAGGLLTWRWNRIRAKITISHVRIRYAQRRLTFRLDEPCELRRGDSLEITASLHQLR